MRISPAMIGAVALMTAVLGSFATASASVDANSLTSVGSEAAGSPRPTASEPQGLDEVDVSRSFDRTALARQTAQQARQRARALKEIDRDITARASDLKQQEKQQEKKRRDQLEEKRRNQWVLPVTGYTLTARFGQGGGMWSSGAHTGLDFAGPSGTKLVALAAGTVKSAGYSGSYGNQTVITLADGTEISYSHQSRIVVSPGDKVQPGQLTGYTGATGNVTGPHLHLEVKPPGSGPVDPEPLLREHGINP